MSGVFVSVIVPLRANPVLQDLIGGQPDRILGPRGLRVLVDLRHREAGVGPEIEASDFTLIALQRPV